MNIKVKMVLKEMKNDTVAVYFCTPEKVKHFEGKIIGVFDATSIPKECSPTRLEGLLPYCEGIFAKQVAIIMIGEFCGLAKIFIDMEQFKEKFEVYADNCVWAETIEKNQGAFSSAYVDRYTKCLDMFGIEYKLTGM